jgi:hypothetical protein
MDSQAPTESAPSRSKVLLEEIRVALERTRSSFVSSGLLAVLVLSGFYLQEASAAEQAKPDPAIEKRIQELIPSLEGYIATGMKAFDVPGLAIGIVAGDKLIYAKGFGGRRKGGGELVDARTVFQIGSTTKAFLAASMAITARFIGTIGLSTSIPIFSSRMPGSRASFESSICSRSARDCPRTPMTRWACSASTRSR